MKISNVAALLGSVATLAVVGLAGPASAQSSGCSGEAAYRVTFDSQWIESSHSSAVPSNAHFSPMMVATHKESWRAWERGGQSTPGITQVAETGATAIIRDEWSAAFNAGDIRAYRTGQRMDAVDSVSVELNAASDRDRLTFISMIAPSPDWFLGTSGYALCEGGNWIDEAVIDLGPYDAGTDDGQTLKAADQPTSPRQAIHRLNKDFQASDSFEGAKFGTLTIKRI